MVGRALGTFVLLVALLGLHRAPAWSAANGQEHDGVDRRVALVVGNSAYSRPGAWLRNPARDAEAVAAALSQLGFHVTLVKEADQAAFADAVHKFLTALDSADVGLFYFAGHGLQVDGKNYLLSVDAKVENELLLPAEGMELATIVSKMEQHARLNIVIVDACRDNPFEEALRRQAAAARGFSTTRGLAPIEARGDTLVVYATASNETAADGDQEHSPFTKALLDHINTPNLEISAMLKRVTKEVLDRTGNQQKPEVVASMASEFYFKIAKAAVDATTPIMVTPAPSRPSVDDVIRDTAAAAALELAKGENTTGSYQDVIDRFPGTREAQLAAAELEKLAGSNGQSKIALGPLPFATTRGGTDDEEKALNLTAEDRKGIQILLSTLGYDTKGIDGNFGPGTRSAIKALQYARNQEATGFLGQSEYSYLSSQQDLPESADPRLKAALQTPATVI